MDLSSVPEILAHWNAAFQGFTPGHYETDRLINRHIIDATGLVRRQVNATIRATQPEASEFRWRVPLPGSAELLGAWPDSAPQVIHALRITDPMTVDGTRFRDLVFTFAPLSTGQTLTISFEYVLIGVAQRKVRWWSRLFESETTYGFAYKTATSTRSLSFFIHLPAHTNSYRIESSLGRPTMYMDGDRAVLALLKEDHDSRGDHVVWIAARSKSQTANATVPLLIGVLIALVQLSARGYTAWHAIAAILIGALGAVATRLAAPRAWPRAKK